MKQLVVAFSVFLLLMGAVGLLAEGRDPDQVQTVRANQGTRDNVPVTIQYDAGGAQDFFYALSGNLDVFGNSFTSATGLPLKSGTVTGLSFFGVDNGGSADLTLSFIGPPAGGVAQLYTYINFTGIINSAFNTAAVSQPVGPTFLVGGYVGTFNGPDSFGGQSQSYAGQGFHAFQGDFLGAYSIGSIASLPAQNAMIRASGPLAMVPVELINFEVE